MQNKKFCPLPINLTTTTTTNLFNPGTTTGGTNCTGSPNGNLRVTLTHIRATNNSAGALSFALWRGTTGTNTAGKEFAFAGIAAAGTLTNGVSIPANGSVDWYGEVPFDVADFLVGGGSAAGVALELEGEIGVA